MNFWIALRRIKVISLIVIILFASFFYFKVRDPDEIVPVFPPMAIKAVSNPSFENFTPPPGDPIIGIEINNESRAYPISLLEWHGVVNDLISGILIAVTYSFLSDSAVVYSRVLNGRVLTFAVHNGVYKNNLLLLDEETQSLWSQIDGKAIKGVLTGRVLTRIPSVRTDWSNWETLHPSTLILEPPSNIQYGIHPYGNYKRNDDVLFPHQFDDPSLRPKDSVLGIDLNGTYSAYPISRLSNERVVMDVVDSTRIVVTYAHGAAFVYVADDRSFTYISDSTMEDQYTNRWNMTTGISENGNQSLTSLQANSTVSYWFAWLNFHPRTKLYGYESRQLTEISWLELGFPWIVGLLLCLFVILLDRYSGRRMRDSANPPKWIAFRRSILLAILAFLMFLIVMMDSLGNLMVTNIAVEVLFALCFLALGVAMALEWFYLKGYEGARIPIDIHDFRENLRMVFTLQEIENEEREAAQLGLVKTEGGYTLAKPNVDLFFSGNWLFAGNSTGYSAQEIAQTKRIAEMSLTTLQEEELT